MQAVRRSTAIGIITAGLLAASLAACQPTSRIPSAQSLYLDLVTSPTNTTGVELIPAKTSLAIGEGMCTALAHGQTPGQIAAAFVSQAPAGYSPNQLVATAAIAKEYLGDATATLCSRYRPEYTAWAGQ